MTLAWENILGGVVVNIYDREVEYSALRRRLADEDLPLDLIDFPLREKDLAGW